MNEEFLAIEIENSSTWQMLCSLVPHLKELNEAENIGSFFLLDFESEGSWAICTPATVREHFRSIEEIDSAKFVRIVK